MSVTADGIMAAMAELGPDVPPLTDTQAAGVLAILDRGIIPPVPPVSLRTSC